MRRIQSPVPLLLISLVFLRPSTAIAQLNPEHDFKLIEEEGVLTAKTTGGPKYLEPLFSFEKIQVFHSDPSNEDSYLFQPSGFLAGPDGFFYVADSGNNRVAVFNPDGKYVRDFGGKGFGPGDFQRIEIQDLRDDVLYLFDAQIGRVTRFTTGGDLLDVTTAPNRGSFLTSFYRSHDDGKTVSVTMDHEVAGEFSRSWKRVSVNDSSGNHVAHFNTPKANAAVIKDGGLSADSMWYAPIPQVLFIPDTGIMLCNGDEPVVYWRDLSGNLTRQFIFEFPEEPVTREDRENIKNYMVGDSSDPRRRARVEALDPAFPGKKAHWHHSYVDDAGFTWLYRFWDFEAEEKGLGTPCMVLSPEGEYLGMSYVPTVRGHIRGGLCFALLTDKETGESIPTVFRITPAVEGLVYP